ncbi:hypothetical protein HGRIS_005195 [Hohenbuehelia grisea]|uniref:START domain-containing protein n=1 Tax=Hohenbuehelia grisea TaxID=104357 RepID=A0ABR3JEH4_9AGAR
MSDGSSLRESWYKALNDAEAHFRRLLTSTNTNEWKRIANSTDINATRKGKARISSVPELADVLVYRKANKSGEDAYRVVLDVPLGDDDASLEPWKTVLTTAELRQEWDPAVEEAHLVELVDQNTRVCKTNFTLGWPANPRDAVTISRSFHDASTFIDLSTSLPRSPDEPVYLRPSPPYVRSHVTLFAWCVQHIQPSPQPAQSTGESSKRKASLGNRLRITCFWQHDLRAMWNIGSSTAITQQLCMMTIGLLKSVKKRGSRIPKLSGFGNGVSIERIRFQIDREALTIDYSIIPEDEDHHPDTGLAQGAAKLALIKEQRRLARSVECVLPALQGWDVQIVTKASSELVEKLPWTAHAIRSSSRSSVAPTSSEPDQIVLRLSHAPLFDDHSVLRVRVVLEVSGPTSGLRLNGLPQSIEDVEQRDPVAQPVAAEIFQDVSSTSGFSMQSASSMHTSHSSTSTTLNSPALGGLLHERSAAADKSILSRVRRNYIYFSSLLQEPEAKWRHTTDARGVSITQLDSIDPTLVVYRAEATFVGVGLWDLYGALVSPGTRAFWDKQHDDAVLLEDVNELTELWHFKSKPTWPANGRDSVVLKTVYKSPTTIHVFAFSADDPHLFPNIPPVEPNIIRTQVDLQGWAIEALSPTTTLLTLLEQSDPKGWTGKTSIPTQMITALAGIGEFAIKCGGPPVVTRLSGAKADDQRYDHERGSFRMEYEASTSRTPKDAQVVSEPGSSSSSPVVECEIRCDIDTWATSLDVVVDPPPHSISCLRRHRLSAEGGGLWLTLTHDAGFVDDERLLVIVRRGPGKEKGLVMVNGAKVNVDVEEMPEHEIKSLTKRKRIKPARIPLDQPPVMGVIRRRRAEWDADSEANASPDLAVKTNATSSWASAPRISSPLARLLSYAVDQATTTTQQAVAAISPAATGNDSGPSPSRPPMQYALDALAWVQDAHSRGSHDGWTLVSDKGLPIKRKLAPEVSPVIPVHMGEKVIEGVSAEELDAVVSSFDCRKKWDDRFDGGCVLESFGADCRTSFIVCKSGFPFRDRGFYLASVMARAHAPAMSRRSTADVTEHSSNASKNALYVVSASYSPESAGVFAPAKYNPYGLPSGRVFMDAWILETLDPYTKENYAIPSTRCTRIVAVDYAGSIPAAVNSMINATLPRSILALDAYVKSSAPIPKTRLPAPGLVLTERKPDEHIAGLSSSSSSWRLRRRDENKALLDWNYAIDTRVYRSLFTVSLPSSSPRSPTVKPSTLPAVASSSMRSPVVGSPSDVVTPGALSVRDNDLTPGAQSPGSSSDLLRTPTLASSSIPEETVSLSDGAIRSTSPTTARSSSVPPHSAGLPSSPPSATSSTMTIRGRKSTTAFNTKGEVRPPSDVLIGEVVIDSKLYPDGYSIGLMSRFKGEGKLSLSNDPTWTSAQVSSGASPSAASQPALPVQTLTYTMPSTPLHSSSLSDDPSSTRSRHLVRFTLPTAQYEVQSSTMVDPLTGEVRSAKEVPEWLHRLRVGETALLRVVVSPLAAGSPGAHKENGGVDASRSLSRGKVERRERSDSGVGVKENGKEKKRSRKGFKVEVDGALIPVMDEKESLTTLGRDELLDDRIGKMSVLVRVPADFDSVSLPEELRIPLAVATNLIDTSTTSVVPKVSEDASSGAAAIGETGAEESLPKDGLAVEVRRHVASQLQTHLLMYSIIYHRTG